MLRKIFNKAARPHYLPEKPIVLVSTLGDDKMRGDSHGYIGTGKIVAEKLGGEYHYVDEEILSALYPGESDKEVALAAYLGKIGAPDIVFASYRDDWGMGKNPSLIITGFNEDLTPKRTTEKELVTHHITSDLFKSEGKKFAAAYPDLPRPLIAVMMADGTSRGLSAALMPMIRNFSEGSIFVCGGRRTSEFSYNSMISLLADDLEKAGISDRITTLGYEFQKGRESKAYNPYIGLLEQADHIIVCGDSQSIVSEAIASGKSVHLYGGHDEYKRLERKGLVKQFNNCAGCPLETHAITPVNPTEKAAESIVNSYRHHKQIELGFWRSLGAYLMDG
ncbi:MAG: ELM1/GtrOC1 family putative glycosyltransferase [Micavibrio sp.]